MEQICLKKFLLHYFLLSILLIISLTFLDLPVFTILNKSLALNNIHGSFWAILNHPREKYLNMVVMLSILGVIIARSKEPWNALRFVILASIWLQFAIMFAHYQIEKVFLRPSPSLAIGNFVELKQFFPQFEFRQFSRSSMPSGHALATTYWYLACTSLTKEKLLKGIVVFITTILIFNRLFAGLHWLSDSIASILIAYLWFYLLSIGLIKLKIIKSHKR
ncbi:phosphatase PAP2 family protein [Rickettsiales endosymbiont of Stachyamoeba lipophora]|uniref:phosphatase PAP2 family protein n=1 Tax=Rickettsiales endosymbiont of Stachyamoeba lipophora TaxID=2486578 RepID=UPI0013DE5782|nr:phosphatase PAP2 family protein [Rickettsiales endosymbiont of Stachyamoeba lipophora]